MVAGSIAATPPLHPRKTIFAKAIIFLLFFFLRCLGCLICRFKETSRYKTKHPATKKSIQKKVELGGIETKKR
jgi:hypothetical protein